MRQVRQQRTVEVRLASEDALQSAVDQLTSHVDSPDQITPSPAEAVVRFRTQKTEDQLGEILSAMVGAGVPVTQFREVQADLEDAFLSVTQSEKKSTEKPQEANA